MLLSARNSLATMEGALTLDRLRQLLKHRQHPAHNPRPPRLQALWNARWRHLQQRRQRQDAQLLIVHARELALADRREPAVDEGARDARLGRVDDVQRCRGVVEDGVDEDFEVHRAQGERVVVLLGEGGEGGGDDDLEVLGQG